MWGIMLPTGKNENSRSLLGLLWHPMMVCGVEASSSASLLALVGHGASGAMVYTVFGGDQATLSKGFALARLLLSWCFVRKK